MLQLVSSLFLNASTFLSKKMCPAFGAFIENNMAETFKDSCARQALSIFHLRDFLYCSSLLSIRRGNKHFAAKRYAEAVECYSQAIHISPANHILFGNRRSVGDAAIYAGFKKRSLYDVVSVHTILCLNCRSSSV